MAGPVTVDWSDDAHADLNRFAAFLEEHSPKLAPVVANTIIARTDLLAHYPKLGRPIAGREEYRQLVLEVLGGAYVFQRRGARGDSARVTRGSTADRLVAMLVDRPPSRKTTPAGERRPR